MRTVCARLCMSPGNSEKVQPVDLSCRYDSAKPGLSCYGDCSQRAHPSYGHLAQRSVQS
jgi:hypothetical protein